MKTNEYWHFEQIKTQVKLEHVQREEERWRKEYQKLFTYFNLNAPDELEKYLDKTATDKTGKCSVPMYIIGLPTYCLEPAYGDRPEGKTLHDPYTGEPYRIDGRYAGYVDGIACPKHGGPTLKEVAHEGDPCIHCGLSHNHVPPGPCHGLIGRSK